MLTARNCITEPQERLIGLGDRCVVGGMKAFSTVFF